MFNIYAMEETALKSYLLAKDMAKGLDIEARVSSTVSEEESSIMQIAGDTARISIVGALSPTGPSWWEKLFGIRGTGYSEICACLSECAANENVKTIVLAINSPGGYADGCDATYQAIIEAKCGGKKKVIAENHGIMASAAYWLACAADSITATTPAAETGSIGVIVAGWDISKAAEEAGYKKLVIVSKNAPNKDQSGYAGAGMEALQERVNALERVFIARVAAGRKVTESKVIKDFGKGSVLIAEDPDDSKDSALTVGMIDAVIGGFTYMDDTGTSQNAETPASAGQTTEGKSMGLKELLASNPAAQAEYENAILAARAEGAKQAQGEANKRIEAAAPFLTGEKYPASISTLATKVIKGEVPAEALTSAVAAVDAVREEVASKGAQTEAPDPTPPSQANAATSEQFRKDGVVSNEADVVALAKQLREE